MYKENIRRNSALKCEEKGADHSDKNKPIGFGKHKKRKNQLKTDQRSEEARCAMITLVDAIVKFGRRVDA